WVSAAAARPPARSPPSRRRTARADPGLRSWSYSSIFSPPWLPERGRQPVPDHETHSTFSESIRRVTPSNSMGIAFVPAVPRRWLVAAILALGERGGTCEATDLVRRNEDPHSRFRCAAEFDERPIR